MPRVSVSVQEIKQIWVPKVTRVLKKETSRAGNYNLFLSAYQILQLLPKRDRQRLINLYGQGGLRSGNIPAATAFVMRAVCRVPDVEIIYMESRYVRFCVTNKRSTNPRKVDLIHPANSQYFALYRIPAGHADSRICDLDPGIGSPTLATRRRRTILPADPTPADQP